jgi:hypothetical protein
LTFYSLASCWHTYIYMQAAIDSSETPRCSGCGDSEGVTPSVHAYREPYLCIRCCNYLDEDGEMIAT